ncbi:DNA mismatch repair endonuclease MutL [Vagococcus elongatus]|uniref:DNA mismatch repair protein MutL n=1 Tax=Vagococcus elongatus TaxID=180344 RepID=A0A430APA0_9ENTE|nr:DNA mismatch repair endonuclease MutL [Vagococcus elongatus]RSU10000.1 DNA mismatch repair protein MutL [Vagococcus elongatus]
MGKIQELSEQLANQIAAGEVVERPASVVKELVENALDAGSTQIDIILEESGMKKIQVIDNGEGIPNSEVLNAFKRHATSKIHSQDDLFRIRTLGFRGEALPSIASVSKLTLETSTGTGEGSFVYLEGGKIQEHRPHSLRKGSNLTVSELFYNTPARLKYVKSLQTELSNIADIINRLAMSHPDVAFRLVHDGHQMMSTTGNGELKQAIAGIYGLATAKKMLAVNKEDLDFRLSGYVSLPELTRASRNYLSVIINGRYIRNYSLNKAIVAGYGSKLMVGRFPIAVLKIEMDPLLVDVNVHPTKQEVRLSKEKELTLLIQQGISQVFQDQRLVPEVDTSQFFKKKNSQEPLSSQLKLTEERDSRSAGASSFQKSRSEGKLSKTGLAYDAKEGKFYVEKVSETAAALQDKGTVEKVALKPWMTEVKATETKIVDLAHVSFDKLGNPFDEVTLTALDLEEELQAPFAKRFPELEFFGQMHGTYLFAQNEEGLFIVDQHAAQERIKYEYYREKIGDVGEELQELLLPIVLEYPRSDVIKLKEQLSLLADVGIHLEEFGSNSFIVRAHPAWYPQGEEEQTIREMVDIVLQTGKIDVATFREDTAIMMSCKRSIKANHHLSDIEARQLLADLSQCENPYNCPHGRPVLIHFTNTEMEKMFKRIQDPH